MCTQRGGTVGATHAAPAAPPAGASRLGRHLPPNAALGRALLPVAKSKDLQKHLASVRQDVAKHLNEARARQ